MPKNAYPLADGWPHKHFEEYPDEIHIAPRKAYFVRDGQLLFVQLEELDEQKIADARRAIDEAILPPK